MKPTAEPPQSGPPSATKILVTGASGFIGTRLVRHLQPTGRPIVATDVLPPRERLQGVVYTQWDVRERPPADLLSGFSHIYNLAAVHRTPGHPSNEYYETNVLGACNVVTLAELSQTKNIVFTSSISVYGPSEELIKESSALRPASPYGYSKRLAETIHRDWQLRDAQNRLVIVRPGVVFGPGERGNYTYLANALSRGLFVYPGRRTTIKSGGYVDELLGSIDFALTQVDPYILFNFAYPEQSTTEDIVRTFSEVCAFKAKHTTVPVAPLYAAAMLFELVDKLGIKNPIHRERVLKLVRSTRVEPEWLIRRGYSFQTNLKQAITAWHTETQGMFA